MLIEDYPKEADSDSAEERVLKMMKLKYLALLQSTLGILLQIKIW